MKSSTPSSNRGFRSVFLLVLLVGAGIASYAIWRGRFAVPDQAEGPSVAALPPAEVLRLVALKDVGVGNLENEKLAESRAAFVELSGRLPTEPLGARNLAITQYLLFDKGGLDPEELSNALTTLEQLEPESAATHWLQAKAFLKLRDQASLPQDRDRLLGQGIAALEAAMRLAPQNPIFPYEAFEAVRYAEDPATQARGSEFLAKAFELAPRNLFILVDRLLDQATRKDAGITTTLKQAEELLGPITEGIRRRANVDLKTLTTKAQEAVEQNNWPTVLTTVRGIMPLVRSEEISRSDYRRVAVNPLEFVLYDFSPKFYETNRIPPQEPAPIQVSFKDVPSGSLPAVDQPAREVHQVDFDLDNRPDLVVLTESSLCVFTRNDDGSEWGLATRVEVPAGTEHVVLADLDRDTVAAPASRSAAATTPNPGCFDADPDFVAYGPEGIAVFRNQAARDGNARALERVEATDGLETLRQINRVLLVDFDHDGDLDLVVSSADGLTLWSNRENLTFANLSEWSQLPPAELRFSGLLAVDWDQDVDTDLLLTATDGSLGWLENLRHGQMRFRPLEIQGGAGGQVREISLLDANRDASWDLALAGPQGIGLAQTPRPRPADPIRLAATSIGESAAEHVLSWDYDNDGHLDLLVGNDQEWKAWRGSGDGVFSSQNLLPTEFRATGPVRPVDFDADGDLDLLAIQNGQLVALTNEGGNQNHWLTIRIRGEAEEKSGRVNHWGIGSLIELKSGGSYQSRIVTEQTTHFGLGATTEADIVRVLWPNGVPQSIIRPKIDASICEKMTLKGSCPYLYTWTGERFEFFTDLLWAAPIGLQIADGQLAPSRAWEYLLIPAERLQAREDQYELRITEELWEAGYFDHVSLQAVDHPADVEVYSNEKVGPPEIAAFKIHTVRQRRPLVAARDHRGRDVLAKIASRDGDFLRAFDRTLRQGVAEEHFIELDLGSLQGARQITLFLTGWIYPTDTSLNVAISQNPNVDGPRPPSLHVPDAEGNWREALPFMGFPGGKTKTIAVDLSGLFAANDYRVRIATTAELYWDEMFFTVDERPAEVRVTPFHLMGADLRYRGFSEAYPRQPNAPETYDYDRLSTAPKWPPMGGAFTRYGDVRELLIARDNRHVVMSAGDEMVLSFGGLPPPPEGWKRDFVIHNAGWDKDADLHTVYGQSSEPLPFAEMKSYPYLPPQSFPENPTIKRYFHMYQNRYQSPPLFWKHIKNFSAETKQ